ncbi:MAG: response regulator [bacterium]|nr:response regulator [bacterium]
MSHSILIVDDEPSLLKILSFKLRREGFLTFEATCAEDAETILSRVAVDLIVLDVTLATPTDGFELAERLRQREPTAETPIIMLTARSLASDILRGREINAAGYITKPFSTTDLVNRIHAILDTL